MAVAEPQHENISEGKTQGENESFLLFTEFGEIACQVVTLEKRVTENPLQLKTCYTERKAPVKYLDKH